MRGINEKFLRQGGVRDLDDRIEFPLISVYGKEVGVTIKNSSGYRHIIYKDFKGPGYLYGESILPKLFYGSPIILTEGPWDCLTLRQETLPSVAMNGNQLRWPHLTKLIRYTNKLLFWPDSDGGGEDGLRTTIKRMEKFNKQGPNKFSYRVFRCNKAKDANDLLQLDHEIYHAEITRLRKLFNEFKGI